MNPDDFRYMWRGKTLKALSNQQTDVLASINKRSKNKERALLLLHGFSSSPAVYRELLPALTLYDAILGPALPGHSKSITEFAKVRANDWFSAAEQACRALMQEYKAVDVMGLSLGGLLACHLGNRFTLHHMYLLAPALALKIKIPPTLKLARILKRLGFRQFRNRAGNLHSRHAAELAYRQIPIATIIEILTMINDFEFKLPNCPIDLFFGHHDAVVDSSKVADYFVRYPNVKIHWLANSAHILPLDGDIDSIIACIKDNWKH